MFGTRASQRRTLHSYGLCTNRAIVVNTWRAQMCKDNEVDYQIHDLVGLETLMHIFLNAWEQNLFRSGLLPSFPYLSTQL